MPFVEISLHGFPVVIGLPDLRLTDQLPSFIIFQIFHTVRLAVIDNFAAFGVLKRARLGLEVNLTVQFLITQPVIVSIARLQFD